MSDDVESPTESLQDLVRKARDHYTTVGDMTYSIIRRAIVNGGLAPGERLRQESLAETIGVSRLPVRSALLQLESDGLVTFHPHRGAIVRQLSPEQVREIYSIRLVLETYALTEAMKTMTADRIERLDELAEELDAEEDGERFLELRVAFYEELYQADLRPILVTLIERLRADVGRYWARQRMINRDEDGHRELLKYAREKDVDGAVGWLATHLHRVQEQLASLVAQESQD